MELNGIIWNYIDIIRDYMELCGIILHDIEIVYVIIWN